MTLPDSHSDLPAYFEPQDASHFYAAQGAFFLIDPTRVRDLMGEAVLGSDLIKTLTRKSYPHDAYRQGAIVPALGVEQGHYTVTVRSTETQDAPLPLSHMLFSTGFVLGTETGKLLLCNTDRLQNWTPGSLPDGAEEHPLSSFERTIQIAPAGTPSRSSPVSATPIKEAKRSGSAHSCWTLRRRNPPLPRI